jgi:uncharacterized membrane protein YeiH
VLAAYGLGRESALGAGLLAGLVVRGMALRWGWSLPRYRARPEHAREEVKRSE